MLRAMPGGVLVLASLFTSGVQAQLPIQPTGLRTDALFQAPPGHTPISSLPFVIDNCGSYVVTRCLTGVPGQAGITIAADDVTIDLNGYTLTGVPGSLDGIKTSVPARNLTIVNGNVRNWDGDGLDLSAATSIRLTAVRTSDNVGFGFRIGHDATVVDCAAYQNDGEGLRAMTGCTVTRFVAAENGSFGIAAGLGAVVKDCTSEENGDSGYSVGSGTAISHCVATGNAGHGLQLAARTHVTDCDLTSNALDGIFAGNAGAHFIKDNFSSGNGGDGISVSGSRCHVRENHCSLNAGVGIQLETAVSECLIQSNFLAQNGSGGIVVIHADNFVFGNFATPQANAFVFPLPLTNNSFGPIVDGVRMGSMSGIDPFANVFFHP